MALANPPRGVQPGDLLVVIHDFDARGTDELTLRRGDKIELIELDDGFGDGWFLGKDSKTGTTGLFPGVYTTFSPRIKTRPQTDTSQHRDSGSQNGESDPNLGAPVASKSGQSTPQASRHVSASGMQVPDIDPPTPPSPKQQLQPQQRSSSSPLPTRNMTLDVQQSFKHSLAHQMNGQDSPVMNETLSVIDEHITDLSTPRHSLAPPEPRVRNDSESEYSSHLGHRMSYINGHETDEEEESQPTEEQVRVWDQHETAKRLRALGIDDKHCDIFEEQEITGDVLLDMDQDFVMMKEFDFGVMGRRLKTWHKVKAFQEEIKGFNSQPASYPRTSEERPEHTSTFLPRIPTFSEKTGGYHQSRGSSISSYQYPRFDGSMQSNTSPAPTYSIGVEKRPSAASIRNFNHSRRHSSIDTTNRSYELADSPPRASHQPKSSLDRAWSMAGGNQRVSPRPGTSLGTTTSESTYSQQGIRGADPNECDSAISVTDRYDDLDRGYFSGPEGDTKKGKRVLVKRGSAASGSISHSRKSSYNDDPFRIAVGRRHSRIGSIDSIRDAANHAFTSSKPSSSGPPAPPPKGRLRSLSTRIVDRSGHSSQSSNAASLEDKTASGAGFFSSLVGGSGSGKAGAESAARSSPLPFQQHIRNAGPKFRRAVGLRTTTDIVGKVDTSGVPSSPIKDSDPSSIRTGSTTPSATSKSSERVSTERQSTDGSGKAIDGAGGFPLPRPKPSVKSSVKTKKDTSAYIQGLEKKSPNEQMTQCDYSGWMKKRSSNLMTTWKPRLFVLRGRRLSYYYSDTDKEERGLIDITGHRVLRADNDPIITLHATLTGATASPTSPASAAQVPTDKLSKSESSGPFFFKLVPPKAGVARSVQFTKPAVHYFQVDSVKEGRLWMAALMKATIERDMEIPVETTYKHDTVSLKQARLMNQRPPGLLATPTPQEEDEDKAEERARGAGEEPLTTNDGAGLGLGLEKSPTDCDDQAPPSPLASNPLGNGSSTLVSETAEK
ncbi:putative polarized growth protein (Boi2) [Aspergillus chevalieri]|uniref:Polar growth protein n=1 Tax=Aspergillus chevalieri TaxID=182096 RepID=A0A7R7VIJ0_ASPCH|nr:polar growth protein [Aspergillus chevalieri]BCR85274.1 polar growth protein [Aspergillus chevalieri]